jgi:hypothetical protein
MKIKKQYVTKAIGKLSSHAFTVIQLSDKEKFHTGMLCYTLNEHPSLFNTVFKLPTGEDYKAVVEEKTIDLLITQGGAIKLIVESKLKTGLHESKTPKRFKISYGENVNQLEKIQLNNPNLGDNGYYLLSLFPEIEENKFGFKGLQFTESILSEIEKVCSQKNNLINLWIEYLKQLKVLVDYFVENNMDCINLNNSDPMNPKSLNDLLKEIKLNGVFESYRYGLIQKEVQSKLLESDVGKQLKKTLKEKKRIEQIGELFNSNGNAGLEYSFGRNQKYFGIQWQGSLKLFIVTEKIAVKEGVKDIQKNLGLSELKYKNGLSLPITKGVFSSVTIKRDWNIYEDITDKPIEIIKLLNNLNQNENFKITDKQ